MATANSAAAAVDTRGDVRTIGLVGLAHFISHFLLLALAPLLPLIKAEFDVSFTQLGLVLTLFFATSGAGQVVAGILVDRFGPHRLLLSGIALQAAAVIAMGFAPSFPFLFPIAFVAGIGNTVYHPSDLSILSRRVSRQRQGRAFASHSMAGSLGFAVSPVAVGLAAATWGWRPALIGAGVFGLIVAIGMLLNRSALRADDFHPHATTESERNGTPAAKLSFVQILALPVVLFGFGFFFLSTLAFGGLMPIGALIGIILLVELLLVVGSGAIPSGAVLYAASPTPADTTNTLALGEVLYTQYAYLFQASGLVLLVAMIGAIVLTHRTRPGVKRQNIARQVGRTPEDAIEIKKVTPGQGI